MLYALAQLPWWFWIPLLLVQGGIVGSFLNVLVYRMPAGLNIAWPGSRCPQCGTAIKVRDNLPVIGWLLLRGRCRACQQSISSRYPLVELTTAILFVVLYWAEPMQLGRFLPNDVWTLPAIWQIYANHLLLVCCLLTALLIERDGFPLPWRLVLVWLMVAVPMGVFWPAIHPISPPIISNKISIEPGSPICGMLDGVVGLLVGATLGALAGIGTGEGPSRLAGRNTLVACMAAVGAQLGWQATCSLAAVTGLAMMLAAMFGIGVKWLKTVPNTGWLFAATVAWLFVWKSVVARWPWLGSEADYRTLASGAIVVFATTTVAWLFRPRDIPVPPMTHAKPSQPAAAVRATERAAEADPPANTDSAPAVAELHSEPDDSPRES